MSDGGAKRSHVRIAAAILAALFAAAVVFTYLAYTAAFTSTDKVTVTSPRAGLVMDRDAKVKYRGIQIGEVKSIDYAGDQAKLTLAIDSNEIRFIPSNAVVRIASTTVFGAKSVEFVPPEQPSGSPLRPGSQVQASSVQLEVNTLFQTLTDVLHKIDPVQLNGTLSALAEGLRGHGDDLGALLTGLNYYLQQLNPKLPTLQQDFQKTAVVANIYGDAGPDLTRILDNVPAISNTIVDEQDNLNATLLAATGLANNGADTLEPAENDYIAAVNRLRAPLKVAGDYSPEFGCILEGTGSVVDFFAPIIGGTRPGLFVSSNFLPGSPAYTYPESLPIVNGSGGPNCRGLPHVPSKQLGGSWYHTPFLVTDNAYVPYQPNTELQFDAPSTAQFLFNGAYAERDDY
jgi:phospholipid/cholesterol/gamma-HCH transport system substrate-binding protein